MGKKQTGETAGPMPDIKPEVTFRVGSDSKVLSDLLKKAKHGKVVTVEVKGEVVGFRSDEYDQSVTLRIKSVECHGSMGGELHEMTEKRKRY